MTIAAFVSNIVDIFEVNSVMLSKGWHLNADPMGRFSEIWDNYETERRKGNYKAIMLYASVFYPLWLPSDLTQPQS